MGRETAANLYLKTSRKSFVANLCLKIALGDATLSPTALVGYLAASLVFATFCTKRMVTLRALAITSNIAFICYGYFGELRPILILHAAMLPVNIHRLRREVLLERPSDIVQRFRSCAAMRTPHSGKSNGDYLSLRSSAPSGR